MERRKSHCFKRHWQPLPFTLGKIGAAKPQTAPKKKETKAPQKEEKIIAPDSLDYDKLAFAVSMAETGGCKDGTAKKRNNCFGIMQWNKQGVRSPKYYQTKEEGFADFKRIWKKSYKRFPDTALAAKWTGNDNPETWLHNVKHYYYQ